MCDINLYFKYFLSKYYIKNFLDKFWLQFLLLSVTRPRPWVCSFGVQWIHRRKSSPFQYSSHARWTLSFVAYGSLPPFFFPLHQFFPLLMKVVGLTVGFGICLARIASLRTYYDAKATYGYPKWPVDAQLVFVWDIQGGTWWERE